MDEYIPITFYDTLSHTYKLYGIDITKEELSNMSIDELVLFNNSLRRNLILNEILN